MHVGTGKCLVSPPAIISSSPSGAFKVCDKSTTAAGCGLTEKIGEPVEAGDLKSDPNPTIYQFFLKCYFYIPGGCLEFLNYQQYQTQSHQHVVHPSWLHASWLRSATWWQTSVHSLNWIFPHPKYTPCTGKHIYRICKSTLHESNPPKGKHVFFPSRTVFFETSWAGVVSPAHLL